jgi:hypothetical protein
VHQECTSKAVTPSPGLGSGSVIFATFVLVGCCEQLSKSRSLVDFPYTKMMLE